jgi:hypothetical protein
MTVMALLNLGTKQKKLEKVLKNLQNVPLYLNEFMSVTQKTIIVPARPV